MTEIDRRGGWRWLLPVLAAAALLRVATADYSLWLDELASLVFAHQPVGRLWSGWMLRETNPPLFYTALGQWIALFGDDDRTLRLLPIAIGLAGIAGAFGLGRELGGVRAGLIAAILLAVAPGHVEFSGELRGYGLGHSAVLWALWGAARFERSGRWPGLALYAVASAVALYAHTMLALFVALANLVMLWRLRRRRAALGRWLAANVALAAAWSWWAWISVAQALTPDTNFGWITKPGWRDALAMTEQAYLPPTGVGAALVVALAALILWLGWRFRTRPGVALLAVLALASPVALFAISQRVPVFLPRTLYWANGPVTVLLALGLAQIADRWVRWSAVGVLAAVCALGLASWYPMRANDRWDAAAALLAARAPGVPVLVHGETNALAFAHYAGRQPVPLRLIAVRSAEVGAERWGRGLFRGQIVTPGQLPALVAAEGRVASISWGGPDTIGMARVAARAGPPLQSERQPIVQLWKPRG